MADRRSIRLWTYAATGLAGGIALLCLPLLVFGRPVTRVFPDPTRIAQMVVVVTLALAWGIAFAILAYRNADEFTQEGSRIAWYWGGVMGIAASAPVYAFIIMGGLHWLWPASPVGKELARAFAFGYALPLGMQLVGFVIVSAWWRLSKR
jgi:hypothetical protein